MKNPPVEVSDAQGPEHCAVRLLSAADIPAALELSTEAGWNQTAEDWAALLLRSPEGCLCVECDGRIVATTTLVCYETGLGWVGMVLTHPDYRRRGFARNLVARVIEIAGEHQAETLKLDATDQGRPLYQSLGFVDEQPIERWGWDNPVYNETRRASEFPEIREPGGYLLHRPGIRAHYLGPCVADDVATAELLFRRALDEIGADHYFWDLLPANSSAVAIAEKLGFTCLRRLTRMVRGPNPPRDETRNFAITGFEWG